MTDETGTIVSIDDSDAFCLFIKAHFNYDFSNYAGASLRRRIARIIEEMQLPNTQALINTIRQNPHLFETVLKNIAVNVTEMFRDPSLWLFLRQNVLPDILRSKKELTIWHCGCSSGEEIYSTKILTDELAPQKKTKILATDFVQSALNRAKEATYTNKKIKSYQVNYLATAGRNFNEHFEFYDDNFQPTAKIKNNIKFDLHDLVLDEPILATFDIIFCRNIFIYFNQELQDLVLNKLHQSLAKKGLLVLGAKESISWCKSAYKFRPISNQEKIFQKID